MAVGARDTPRASSEHGCRRRCEPALRGQLDWHPAFVHRREAVRALGSGRSDNHGTKRSRPDRGPVAPAFLHHMNDCGERSRDGRRGHGCESARRS